MMSLRRMVRLVFLVAVTGFAEAEPKPNFVIIFCDDMGYGDVGCFGSKTIKTPNIDGMAEQGLKLTSFYAQTVCGPSRASLMTGCYPLRVAQEQNRVEIHPYLHTEEITIAEVLREAGYVTMAIGKWDLAGHSQTKFSRNLLPTLAGLAGGKVPSDRVIDGRDISVLLETADGSGLEKRPYYFYGRRRLEAVRMGKWKLHLPLPVAKSWAKTPGFSIRNPAGLI